MNFLKKHKYYSHDYKEQTDIYVCSEGGKKDRMRKVPRVKIGKTFHRLDLIEKKLDSMAKKGKIDVKKRKRSVTKFVGFGHLKGKEKYTEKIYYLNNDWKKANYKYQRTLQNLPKKSYWQIQQEKKKRR